MQWTGNIGIPPKWRATFYARKGLIEKMPEGFAARSQSVVDIFVSGLTTFGSSRNVYSFFNSVNGFPSSSA